jgi:hypothetical protein
MHVYFPNRFDIFLQMAMQDSNSEPNQEWKCDLQPMCPEALPSRYLFLSPRNEPLEPGYIFSGFGRLISAFSF